MHSYRNISLFTIYSMHFHFRLIILFHRNKQKFVRIPHFSRVTIILRITIIEIQLVPRLPVEPKTREYPIRTRVPPFDSSRCIAFQYHIPAAAAGPLIQSYFKRGSKRGGRRKSRRKAHTEGGRPYIKGRLWPLLSLFMKAVSGQAPGAGGFGIKSRNSIS